MDFAAGQEKYIFFIKKLSSFFMIYFQSREGEVTLGLTVPFCPVYGLVLPWVE